LLTSLEPERALAPETLGFSLRRSNAEGAQRFLHDFRSDSQFAKTLAGMTDSPLALLLRVGVLLVRD